MWVFHDHKRSVALHSCHVAGPPFADHGIRERTHGEQVVAVQRLDVGRHLLNPGQHVRVTADAVAARLIDQVPRQNCVVVAVYLHTQSARFHRTPI